MGKFTQKWYGKKWVKKGLTILIYKVFLLRSWFGPTPCALVFMVMSGDCGVHVFTTH